MQGEEANVSDDGKIHLFITVLLCGKPEEHRQDGWAMGEATAWEPVVVAKGGAWQRRWRSGCGWGGRAGRVETMQLLPPWQLPLARASPKTSHLHSSPLANTSGDVVDHNNDGAI